ncbi:MAG: alpha-amylase family glycosyl hydrolase [Bacteroidales bacterium]
MKPHFNRLFLLIAASLFSMSALQAQKGPQWLSEAVFYQIYPSSYKDSDGNGIGDLPGIESKLDYIQSLGVNALWLNPIYESGWFDGGYDIIDFYKVDPRFGTNTDLVNLVDEAHKRGIKVCLDLVAGHSSDKCEWFKKSMEADHNQQYSDYFIWTDSVSDKEKQEIAKRMSSDDPATSKKGRFVEIDAPRAKYYEKNYYACQPALNYGYAKPDPSHPWEQSPSAPGPQAVKRELMNVMQFWFDKGVDGFRVDMAASLVKDDPDKSATIKLWDEIMAWKEKEYPQKAMISEWSNPTQSIAAGFNIDFMIHIGVKAYAYLFFDADGRWGKSNKIENAYFETAGKGSVKEFFEHYLVEYGNTKSRGYIALPSANHDFQRLSAGKRDSPDQLKVAMTFLLTMPGVPFIYYGDEIGMRFLTDTPNVEGSRDRSGTRTPMQWADDASAGFSTCDPSMLYLPVFTKNGTLTVESQENDPNSLLNYVRGVLALRKSSAALGNNGDLSVVSDMDSPYPLVYKRSSGSESFLVVLNPSAEPVSVTVPVAGEISVACVTGKVSAKAVKAKKTTPAGTSVKLAGVSAAVLKIN